MRFLALCLLLLVGTFSARAEEPAFTPEQEQQIIAIMREYLLQHPEILNEMVQALQQRDQLSAASQRDEVITGNLEKLQNDPNSPVIGNPSGDVVVVEFFDYNCGYCRKATQDIFDLVKSDGNIKYVLKEFPIFGEDSEFAAKAALASVRQGKYDQFHYAMMTAGIKIDKAAVLAIAKQVGLDVAQLEADMQDPIFQQVLDDNYKMAEALQIDGTPAFLFGTEFYPGWLPREEMEKMIELARQ